MYIKFVVSIFLSFVLLVGCSSDSGTAITAGTSSTLLATSDKSDVRVNDVRIYSNSIPSLVIIYDSNGAMLTSIESTVDIASRTITEVIGPMSDGDPTVIVDEHRFNEFGQLTLLESQRFQNGIAIDDKETILEMFYDSEQLITRSEPNTTLIIGSQIIFPVLGQIRYEQDDSGRVVKASSFIAGGSQPEGVWTREYGNSGWIETEIRESLFSPDAEDREIREVTLNEAGLVERILETSESELGFLTPNVTQSSFVLNYDEQGRLIESLLFDDDGELFQRTEFLDYQDIDLYLHNLNFSFFTSFGSLSF